MKSALKETLRDLVALHGAPGFEQPLVQYFRKRAAGLVDRLEVDRYGNVTAVRQGRQQRPRLMLSAHLDEIGFVVKGIEPSGFLRFDRLGFRGRRRSGPSTGSPRSSSRWGSGARPWRRSASSRTTRWRSTASRPATRPTSRRRATSRWSWGAVPSSSWPRRASGTPGGAYPAMKRHLLAAAEAEGIPVQLATHMNRGSTEAGTIHLVREGVPTISVGVPRRYSYSPNEVVDLNDVAQAVRLLVRFVGDMDKHGDLEFA